MRLISALAILGFCVFQKSYAQRNQLSVVVARSFNGTGDMKGFGFFAEYGKYLTNRVELTAAIGTNIHHSRLKVSITSPGQETTDASVRFVTAGTQLTAQANFALIRTKTHEFKIGIGPLFRYQASSYPDVYSIYYPSQTGIPEITVSFRQFEKQEILTAGYIASASYCVTVSRGCFVGITGSFQNDTNGDLVTQYGFKIGKRF